MFDYQALKSVKVETDPYTYLMVPNFLHKEACDEINANYPDIKGPGSFPLSELTYGPKFEAFLDELRGPEFRRLMSEKFNVDLEGLACTMTIRGHTGERDGRIHTDTKTKIITVLIYMNSGWESEGGRLRILRSPTDIEDYAAEVPPMEGTLLAFKVAPNSYHGHLPFIGQRRTIQFNWVVDEAAANRAHFRHKVSAKFKRVKQALGF